MLPASQSCISFMCPPTPCLPPGECTAAALPPGPPNASGRLADDHPEGLAPSSQATSSSQGGLTVGRCILGRQRPQSHQGGSMSQRAQEELSADRQELVDASWLEWEQNDWDLVSGRLGAVKA